jgi:hypothetical protein
MKYYEFELNGRTVKLRLTSNDCIEIEKKTGKKLLDFMEDYSMSATIMLLMYMVRSSVPNFSIKDAGALYDEMIDSEEFGSMESVLFDAIYEGMVVSGFLKKEDLEEMKSLNKNQDLKEEITKSLVASQK